MQYYGATIVIAVCTALMLLLQAARNDALPRRMKRAVVQAALLIAVAALCEYAGVAMNGKSPAFCVPHRIVKFVELSLAPFLPVVVGNAVSPSRYIRWIAAVLTGHALVEFLSMWLGITAFVSAENVYVHCAYYWLYYAAYGMGTAFMIVRVAHFTRRYQSRNKLMLTVILAFVLVGVLWQAIDSGMKIVWLTVAIGFVMFYIYYCELLQQTDSLTELLNRRSYEIRKKTAKKRAVVLMADVDAFKAANDTYGHQYGDDCLRKVGAALKEAYGKYGLCYRIGGDEFCVILQRQLDGVSRRNAAFARAMQRRREEDPRLPAVSLGYAEFDPQQGSMEQAVALADERMYSAKEAAKAERERRAAPKQRAK